MIVCRWHIALTALHPSPTAAIIRAELQIIPKSRNPQNRICRCRLRQVYAWHVRIGPSLRNALDRKRHRRRNQKIIPMPGARPRGIHMHTVFFERVITVMPKLHHGLIPCARNRLVFDETFAVCRHAQIRFAPRNRQCQHIAPYRRGTEPCFVTVMTVGVRYESFPPVDNLPQLIDRALLIARLIHPNMPPITWLAFAIRQPVVKR